MCPGRKTVSASTSGTHHIIGTRVLLLPIIDLLQQFEDYQIQQIQILYCHYTVTACNKNKQNTNNTNMVIKTIIFK